MNRVRHFAANVGTWGVVRTVAVTFGVMILSAICLQKQDYVAPTVAALSPFVTYAARRWLTNNLVATKIVMNLVAATIVVSIVLFRKQFDFDVAWMRQTIVIVPALYICCFFWVYSDPKVVAGRWLSKFAKLMDELEVMVAEAEKEEAEEKTAEANSNEPGELQTDATKREHNDERRLRHGSEGAYE